MSLFHSRPYLLTARQTVDRPLDEVFELFGDARNLEALTPPFLRFRIVTPQPIEMRVGTLIDYRLRVRGIPMGWRTEIEAWNPPHSFADRQLRGPYRRWLHLHLFESDGDRTVCRDRVEIVTPGPDPIARLWVLPDVRRIFRYRQQRLSEILTGRPYRPHSADFLSIEALPPSERFDSLTGARTAVE